MPDLVSSFKAAAEQGEASAQFQMGLKCERGEGVGRDYSQAAHWYEKAAEQGHAEAQLNLGVLYYQG
jgi:TPR repeat protein